MVLWYFHGLLDVYVGRATRGAVSWFRFALINPFVPALQAYPFRQVFFTPRLPFRFFAIKIETLKSLPTRWQDFYLFLLFRLPVLLAAISPTFLPGGALRETVVTLRAPLLLLP